MPRLLFGAALLNLLLLLPLWVRFGGPVAPWIALEAPLVVALLAWLPRRPVLRWLSLALLLAGLVVSLGDAATRLAFGRGVNLYLDAPLLRSVGHLLAGALGQAATAVVLVIALIALALMLRGLDRGLAGLQGRARGRPAALAVMLLTGGALIADLGSWGNVPWARAPVARGLVDQGGELVTTRAAHRDFAARMAEDPTPARPLPGLAGRDVVMLFVESYGADTLADSPYAEHLRPRLDALERRLAEAGLSAVTTTLAAPIRGGQSWLAHASALSGVRIDNALWYRLMLAGDHATLVDDFRATGHRSVAVMPAITLAWPEGDGYGFDAIHAAAELDYAGPPLNWVTMPDQYTLHRFQQAIRAPAEAPLFAQVALISSHAPWTPILPILDWDEVGDGRVYDRWASAGEAPEALWQDLDRVREHYARSLGYAVEAAGRWTADFAGDDDLVILLGDHPAAPLIVGEGAGYGVPVHLISGDPALLAPFRARGFVPGLMPPDGEPRAGQEALRGWLHEEFGR